MAQNDINLKNLQLPLSSENEQILVNILIEYNLDYKKIKKDTKANILVLKSIYKKYKTNIDQILQKKINSDLCKDTLEKSLFLMNCGVSQVYNKQKNDPNIYINESILAKILKLSEMNLKIKESLKKDEQNSIKDLNDVILKTKKLELDANMVPEESPTFDDNIETIKSAILEGNTYDEGEETI